MSVTHFPADYFHARERFRALADTRDAVRRAYPITARGPGDEELTIDTAYVGTQRPHRLLILSSGTHGVEGFAGSAGQQLFLDEFLSTPLPSDAGVSLIHGVNPFGFAHLRRVNENNVDLNRNALAQFPGPPNPTYRRLNAWLNPNSLPSASDLFLIRRIWHLLTHGSAAVREAIAGGQYKYPNGLFYGGAQREQSICLFASIIGEAWFTQPSW